MPTVTIGITNKKINSTKQTFGSSVSLSCKLKEKCSMHDPVFIVEGLSKAVNYNYASFESKYYWIDNVVYVTNTIQEVYCHLDPLATYKTDISNTGAYVLFGDSAHLTGYRDDVRFGPDKKRNRPSGEIGVTTFDMGFNKSSWTVIMVCQCATAWAYSSVVTYAMSISTYISVLKGFSGTVQSDVATWSGTDVIDVLKNFATKLLTGGAEAIDNIRSAIMVPIPLSTFSSHASSSSNTVYMGPYSIQLDSGTVYVMDPSYTITGNGVVSLHRPIASTTYKWLNSPKYCSIQLSHPCGYQEINTPALLENTQIYLWWSLNICSGEYTIRVTSESAQTSDTVAMVSGSTAIDIMGYTAIAGGNNLDSNLFNNTANALVSAVSGGVYGVNTGAMSPSGMGNSVPTGYTSISILEQNKECFVNVEYYLPSIFDGTVSEYVSYCNTYGYPVGRYLTVGDITGYCQCMDATVQSSNANAQDKTIINTYLNSGIYIE